MDKILKLLIEDFGNQKPSAEYQLALKNVCEMEMRFMTLLNNEQKAEYLNLDFIASELGIIELRDFAEFLHSNLKQ